ncbi:MAG: dihydroorotate dehydrogenase (quinone), partial [Candidatus Paceibacterota bacterium]
FSPDMSDLELDRLLAVARNHRIHGIICTNLTKKRDNPNIFETNVPEKGGMSGKIVQDMSDKMLSYIYRKEGKRFVLVGSGGVFSAEDAYRKIRLGASLVQLITGMIFEGPQLIGQINKGLAELLKRDGFNSVSEAVGKGVE